MNPIKCLITGGRGYLGSVFTRLCEELGYDVFQLQRTCSVVESKIVPYSLGSVVVKGDIPSADTLIHCAYDFAPSSWSEICRVNVDGSKRLFEAALEAGVKRIIFISSIATYPGCRSLYGKGKLLGDIRKQIFSLI